MKGISAVVATILLLLIVIAIVGFAFGFFQRLFSTAATGTEAQTGALLNQSAQRIDIENAQATAVSLRNRGTATVPVSSLAFFVNGVSTTCAFGAVTTIAPNNVASCTLAVSCGPGSRLRVTAIGSDETRACT